MLFPRHDVGKRTYPKGQNKLAMPYQALNEVPTELGGISGRYPRIPNFE